MGAIPKCLIANEVRIEIYIIVNKYNKTLILIIKLP